MVIYVDTSALLKLYVEEEGRALVEEAAGSTTIITSTVTYAEARSGLARRLREGDFTSSAHREIVSKLDSDWMTFDRLEVSNLVAYHAGEFAERLALRGHDAIHLASAVHLIGRFDDLSFLAFDHRLVDATREAGVSIYTD